MLRRYPTSPLQELVGFAGFDSRSSNYILAICCFLVNLTIGLGALGIGLATIDGAIKTLKEHRYGVGRGRRKGKNK